MELVIRKMNEQLATNILNWKYDKPYDFYNNELTDENMREKLDGTYYALVDDAEELIGFFALVRQLKFRLETNMVFIPETLLIWDWGRIQN